MSKETQREAAECEECHLPSFFVTLLWEKRNWIFAARAVLVNPKTSLFSWKGISENEGKHFLWFFGNIGFTFCIVLGFIHWFSFHCIAKFCNHGSKKSWWNNGLTRKKYLLKQGTKVRLNVVPKVSPLPTEIEDKFVRHDCESRSLFCLWLTGQDWPTDFTKHTDYYGSKVGGSGFMIHL